MDPQQNEPIVNGEPAQLEYGVVAIEPTIIGGTNVYVINILPQIPDMSFSAPSPLSSSLASSTSTMSKTYPTTSAFPLKAPQEPLTPPQIPPAQVELSRNPVKRNLKRKRTTTRSFKHQIILNDETIHNYTVKEVESIKHSKRCKEQRNRKAAQKDKIESDIERHRREKTEFLAEIRCLKEEIEIFKDGLKVRDQRIWELETQDAKLEIQPARQTDPIFSESDAPLNLWE